MLKLTKIQLTKILAVYLLLAVAAFFCYNTEKLLEPPRKRAFRCNDESLWKPYITDTLTPNELYTLGIYFPIALIAVCELISSFAARKGTARNSSWLLKYVLKSFVILTIFLIGLATERVFKNVAKTKMARLRPNFITVCDPVNTDGFTCQNSEDALVMDEYKCSTYIYPSWAVSTAFVSFPSGHTGLTSYSMIFLICYLQTLSLKLKRSSKFHLALGILIVQIYCFLIIPFMAISRVLDFKHHWSDVCAGFISGTSVAVVVIYYWKSQWQNIEKWSEELVICYSSAENMDTAEEGCRNRNVNKTEDACTIELAVQ